MQYIVLFQGQSTRAKQTNPTPLPLTILIFVHYRESAVVRHFVVVVILEGLTPPPPPPCLLPLSLSGTVVFPTALTHKKKGASLTGVTLGGGGRAPWVGGPAGRRPAAGGSCLPGRGGGGGGVEGGAGGLAAAGRGRCRCRGAPRVRRRGGGMYCPSVCTQRLFFFSVLGGGVAILVLPVVTYVVETRVAFLVPDPKGPRLPTPRYCVFCRRRWQTGGRGCWRCKRPWNAPSTPRGVCWRGRRQRRLGPKEARWVPSAPLLCRHRFVLTFDIGLVESFA